MNRYSICLTTPQGVSLAGVIQGPDGAPPLVLIHGYSDSHLTWELVLDALPESVRAVALTMRGHGDSSKPANGYAIGDFAGDVVDAMDALGIGSAVLAGHSMGSIIAERIAVDHPRRVRGLVLVGAFAGSCDASLVDVMWREGVGALSDPVDIGFVRGFQESCVVGPLPEGFLDAIVAASSTVPARVWQQALRGFVDTGVAGRLDCIRAPTLLQWGELDSYAGRADQDALLTAIPHARLSVFESTGHCPNWEQPSRAAAEIAALVAAVHAPVSVPA